MAGFRRVSGITFLPVYFFLERKTREKKSVADLPCDFYIIGEAKPVIRSRGHLSKKKGVVMELQKVWQIFDDLPANAQQEVIDFIEFLQKRYKKPKKPQVEKKRKLSEEPFYGMWQDREDMKDSVAWVRRLRGHDSDDR